MIEIELQKNRASSSSTPAMRENSGKKLPINYNATPDQTMVGLINCASELINASNNLSANDIEQQKPQEVDIMQIDSR